MNVVSTARRTAQRLSATVSARSHLLALPAAEPRRSGQTVYFLTPDTQGVAGGIRVIYRHVDLLNRAGIPAAVLHQRPGFRCTWFDNDTVVRDVRSQALGPEDLLVVGELNVGNLAGRQMEYPHAVFNQNSYLTWAGHPDRVLDYYRRGPAPRAILTVSEYAREVLAATFADLPVLRVRLQIDPAFTCTDQPRSSTITYMPRKGADDLALMVRAMVEGMGLPAEWRFDPLHGLQHEEVASRLQASRIFLSFATHEGFGLPAAEAMACGNYVIGSHGYGGREFFDPRFCSPVPVGDVLGIAKALSDAIAEESRAPGYLVAKGREAAGFVRDTYSTEAEERDVVNAYSGLLGMR